MRSTGLRSLIGAAIAFAGAVPVLASPPAQNIDLMAKWTAATVVNYKVIAEFSGTAALFTIPGGLSGRGTVTDRFEVEFNWNQAEPGMVGKPIIRNFPSKLLSVLPNGPCRILADGPFEHATIVELKNDPVLAMANAVHGEMQRDLPAGTWSGPNEVGPCANVISAPAKSVRQRLAVPAPNGMMLAMPSGQAGYKHDGKAFTVPEVNSADKGWTYTVTPTIVK